MDSLAVKVGGKPAPPRVAVGRDARGRIVLDVTNWERPAVTVRVDLTPKQAAAIANDLNEQAWDHARNEAPYAYDVIERGADEVLP